MLCLSTILESSASPRFLFDFCLFKIFFFYFSFIRHWQSADLGGPLRASTTWTPALAERKYTDINRGLHLFFSRPSPYEYDAVDAFAYHDREAAHRKPLKSLAPLACPIDRWSRRVEMSLPSLRVYVLTKPLHNGLVSSSPTQHEGGAKSLEISKLVRQRRSEAESEGVQAKTVRQ